MLLENKHRGYNFPHLLNLHCNWTIHILKLRCDGPSCRTLRSLQRQSTQKPLEDSKKHSFHSESVSNEKGVPAPAEAHTSGLQLMKENLGHD